MKVRIVQNVYIELAVASDSGNEFHKGINDGKNYIYNNLPYSLDLSKFQ
jgi:hypothetical protein